LASLGHPSKFQRVSRHGSATARHSSSRRQPNFAALNRGHHLYSAGQPSRWALAHILVRSFSVTVLLRVREACYRIVSYRAVSCLQGGMRAVIWTDVVQCAAMLAGMLTIMIKVRFS